MATRQRPFEANNTEGLTSFPSTQTLPATDAEQLTGHVNQGEIWNFHVGRLSSLEEAHQTGKIGAVRPEGFLQHGQLAPCSPRRFSTFLQAVTERRLGELQFGIEARPLGRWKLGPLELAELLGGVVFEGTPCWCGRETKNGKPLF